MLTIIKLSLAYSDGSLISLSQFLCLGGGGSGETDLNLLVFDCQPIRSELACWWQTFKGPFTWAIFIAQFSAIFVTTKLHQVFKQVRNSCDIVTIKSPLVYMHDFMKLQLRRDKNRLCKRPFTVIWPIFFFPKCVWGWLQVFLFYFWKTEGVKKRANVMTRHCSSNCWLVSLIERLYHWSAVLLEVEKGANLMTCNWISATWLIEETRVTLLPCSLSHQISPRRL